MKDLISKLRRVDAGDIIGFLGIEVVALVLSIAAVLSKDISPQAFWSFIISMFLVLLAMVNFFIPDDSGEVRVVPIGLGVIGGIAWSSCSLFLILK